MTTPLLHLTLRCRDVMLRLPRENDLGTLAALLPDDAEHDPNAELLPGLTLAENRAWLVQQGYWRSLGTWSVSSWSLMFLVTRGSEIVGVQTLEADDFPALRTVDSASWLVPAARGRGLGVAMRAAVLGLAFDRLGAEFAVSSARRDNAASLGVSRRLGYTENGISRTRSPSGVVELHHVRLTADRWRGSGLGDEVRVDGLAPCLPWFGLMT